MARKKGQNISQQRYNDENYDQILFRVKKGKKEEYKKAAEVRGIGLMELARRGIEEYIENHPVEEEEVNRV